MRWPKERVKNDHMIGVAAAIGLAAVVSLLLSFSTIAGRADHKFTGFMNEVDSSRRVHFLLLRLWFGGRRCDG